MGYCGKRTLNTYLQDPTRVINEEEILNVGIQLCKALQYLHAKHIIHRDVKPANIFYMEDGSIRLGDFGLSRDLSDSNSMTNNDLPSSDCSYSQSSESSNSATTTNIGTMLYSSPEQFSSKNYDYKSDVFAAGMVLYEMTYPFFKTNSERFFTLDQPKHGKFPESRPGISQDFYRLIKRMLDINPMERPSAGEAVDEATTILRGRVMVIQLLKEEPFASQQLLITSSIQTLCVSKCIKQILYDEKAYQICMTLMKIDDVLLIIVMLDVDAVGKGYGINSFDQRSRESVSHKELVFAPFYVCFQSHYFLLLIMSKYYQLDMIAKAIKPQLVEGVWRKPKLSARRVARIRKECLRYGTINGVKAGNNYSFYFYGLEWNPEWDKPQKSWIPRTPNGHIYDRKKEERYLFKELLSSCRIATIDKNMAAMPKLIEETRKVFYVHMI